MDSKTNKTSKSTDSKKKKNIKECTDLKKKKNKNVKKYGLEEEKKHEKR